MNPSDSIDPAAPGSLLDRRAIPADAVESFWHAADGHAIRRIDWPASPTASRGALLFLPGRGDCYEKYLETLDHWHRQGWRVTSIDLRGQALSGRLGADATTGHVEDFGRWIEDLSHFWKLWREETLAPHVLVAHSMGGHIALRAVAERKIDPAALVLTAPMLGMLPQWMPTALLAPLSRLIVRLGDPRRPAWKSSEKPGALPKERDELLTHDAERYADEGFWRQSRPELAMGPASWGWIAAAISSIRVLERLGVLEVIATPVLILATRADRLVSYRAARRAAQRLPRGELVSFGEEARHELLREEDSVRDRVIAAIDGFLARVAPA